MKNLLIFKQWTNDNKEHNLVMLNCIDGDKRNLKREIVIKIL